MAHMIWRLPRGQPKLQSGGEQPSHAQLASQRYFSAFVGWGDVRPRLIPSPFRQYSSLVWSSFNKVNRTPPQCSRPRPRSNGIGVHFSDQTRNETRAVGPALPRRRAETQLQRRCRLASPSPSRIHECRCNYFKRGLDLQHVTYTQNSHAQRVIVH